MPRVLVVDDGDKLALIRARWAPTAEE